jgi:hypothetical protein
MKNEYKLLAVFFVLMMSIIHSAFASDSLNTLVFQKDSTKILLPDQKLLPDSKLSFGPADNFMDPKITIAPADNSMDPKISIPLYYAPGPFHRKFNEKKEFIFPEKLPNRK